MSGGEDAGGAATSDVARLVRGSAEARAVLCGSPLDQFDADALLGLQQDPVLRPFVRQWLRSHVSSTGPVADAVAKKLVGEGPARIGDLATEQCLAVIPELAGVFSAQQSRQVADVVVELAGSSPDPYKRRAGAAAARAALVELLAARPELDEFLIPAGSISTDTRVRTALRSLAVALHRDEFRRAPRFLGACQRTRLTDAEVSALAEAASTTRVRVPRRDLWAPLPAARNWLRHSGATLVAYIMPVVVAVVLGQLFRAHPLELLDDVTLEVTLAVFALIATVHALIITLSREHLPRRMARIAATPRILVSAYVASFIGIIASGVDLSNQPGLTTREAATWGHALNALAAAAVLSSAILLAASSFQVLRLSDPVAATTAFGRSSAVRLRRAGTRIGRTQARTLELTTLFDALPNVYVSADAMPGEITQLIRAQSRGLFVPSKKTLRRLLTSPQFTQGMTLRVLAPLGRVIARLDPVLALAPTSSQSISPATQRRATQVARLNGISWLDRSRGVTASLYDLAIRTCRESDQGGAQRAASVCLDLCFAHLTSMETARRRAYERGRASVDRQSRDTDWRPGRATWRPTDPDSSRAEPPPSPVIVDIIDSCVRSLSAAVAAERDIAMYILQGLLAYGSVEDRIPTLMTSAAAKAAGPGDNTGELLRLQLLRRCATRSLELDLRDQFLLVVEAMGLPKMGDPTNTIDETAQALAAAARIDPDAADRQLTRLLSNKHLDSNARIRVLYQIGAAALDAGAIGLSVRCVSELRTPKFVTVTRDWLDMEGVLVPPGSFLGNSPRDSLESFNDLATGIDSLLATTL